MAYVLMISVQQTTAYDIGVLLSAHEVTVPIVVNMCSSTTSLWNVVARCGSKKPHLNLVGAYNPEMPNLHEISAWCWFLSAQHKLCFFGKKKPQLRNFFHHIGQ